MDDIEVLDLEENQISQKEEKTKSKNGIIVGIIMIIVVLLAGYFLFIKNGSDKTLENKLKKASTDYFEKYMSTNDTTSTYVVTLDMLKSANSQGEDYDLKGLEKCKAQSTRSRITINYNDGKPKKVEVELNC